LRGFFPEPEMALQKQYKSLIEKFSFSRVWEGRGVFISIC